MKYKNILASAVSLAIVGASIVSSYTFASYDDYKETMKQVLEDTKTYIQATNNAILSQFYTYNMIGLERRFSSTTKRIYNVFMTIDSVVQYSNYTQYVCGLGSYYTTSDDNSPYPINNSTVRIYADRISFQGENYYFRDEGQLYGYVLYCDLASDTYRTHTDGSTLQNIQVLTPLSVPLHSSYGTLNTNIEKGIEALTPRPVYTDVAPGFPNLPDNWVNGDGNTYNIDLPDFDFNLDLPTYTMPEVVVIPADIVQKSSNLYQIPINLIDRFGLWWLVGLALICTVITIIINR